MRISDWSSDVCSSDLLVLSDPRTLSPEDVDGLLAWVEGGGHLLVRTPPLERGADTRTGALFDVLRLRMVPSHECMRFAESSAGAGDGGEEHRPSWSAFCGGTRFTMLALDRCRPWGDSARGIAIRRLGPGAGPGA